VPARMDHRNRTRPRLARGVAVLALGLGALTACGGDSGSDDGGTAATSSSEAPATTEATTGTATSSPAAGGGSEVQSLTATEAEFSISLDEDTLAAGDYEITVVNNGRASHDLVVEEDGNDVAGTDGNIAPGQSSTFTVTLDAGEYVFYCSVGNHRAMGMELTVQVT
jgi:plastocyanin